MVTRLGHESSFIFDGTIEREGSSSVSIIPAGPSTATVRVGQVHLARGDLNDQAGQQVTVVFAENGNGNRSAAPGSRRLFFTEPFVYGETVGVHVLETADVSGDADALRALIEKVELKADEDRLREHLAGAEVVLHGVVIDRHPVDDPSPLSEHRPDWWVAVVGIESALKGKAEAEVRVRFPNSTDVRWYRTPKPEVGEHAIFVLHRDGLEIGDTGLAILHEDDVIPFDSDSLDRHQRLV